MNHLWISGKLHTWTLIAHGISSNPNEQVDGSGSGGGKKIIPTDTAISGSEPPVVEFDGSQNSIAIQPSHVHSPPLAANSERADSSVSILSTSMASSPSSSSSDCAKLSSNGQCLGWCLLLLIAYYFSDKLSPSVESIEESCKVEDSSSREFSFCHTNKVGHIYSNCEAGCCRLVQSEPFCTLTSVNKQVGKRLTAT